MTISIHLRIRYSNDKGALCFKHAIQRAVAGEYIETRIDDFDSEYYLGGTACVDCCRPEPPPEDTYQCLAEGASKLSPVFLQEDTND